MNSLESNNLQVLSNESHNLAVGLVEERRGRCSATVGVARCGLPVVVSGQQLLVAAIGRLVLHLSRRRG